MTNQSLMTQAFTSARRCAELTANIVAQERASFEQVDELDRESAALRASVVGLKNRTRGQVDEEPH